VNDTTNMLVDARMSLFVIYPGLRENGGFAGLSVSSADANIGEDDPSQGISTSGIPE